MSGRHFSQISLLLLAVAPLLVISAAAQNPNLFPVSNVNVTFYSPLNPCSPMITGLFQGGPLSCENGVDVIFANQSNGAANTVQFNTIAPITFSALRFYANGDGPTHNNLRDFGQATFS
jgi:hypothetical protein